MAANFGSDPWLDARLRNVPLPIGMLGRLSQLANPPDEQLDAAVRDVPLPDGLAERLQQIAEMPRWQSWLPEPLRRSRGIGAGRFAAVSRRNGLLDGCRTILRPAHSVRCGLPNWLPAIRLHRNRPQPKKLRTTEFLIRRFHLAR